MAIRFIDAIDSMGNGGYIDLVQERYIPPKWFSELCKKNDTGFTVQDYEAFECNPTRYLKPPIIHTVAVWGITALQMGIAREQLIHWGMDKKEHWEVLLPRQMGDNDNYRYRCTENEKDIIDAIEHFMLSINQYNAFMSKKNEIICRIVAAWMSNHGISLEE